MQICRNSGASMPQSRISMPATRMLAVDHLPGADDVGGAPMGEEAGRGETGQRQAGEQHRAGAAVHPGNHRFPPAAMTEH